jgi:hypothetical protein
LSIVTIYNAYGAINIFVLCIPLQAWWDKTITDKKCQKGLDGMWALICLHIVTDFLIFALPIPVVARMRLATKQKLGVLFIFALGFLYACSNPSLSRQLTSRQASASSPSFAPSSSQSQ